MSKKLKAVAPLIATLTVLTILTGCSEDSPFSKDPVPTMHDSYGVTVQMGEQVQLTDDSDHTGRILCLDDAPYLYIERSDQDGHRATESGSTIEMPAHYDDLCPLE